MGPVGCRPRAPDAAMMPTTLHASSLATKVRLGILVTCSLALLLVAAACGALEAAVDGAVERPSVLLEEVEAGFAELRSLVEGHLSGGQSGGARAEPQPAYGATG
jgi:hypothetical protein